MTGGKDQIAIIRASGTISYVKKSLSVSSSGIIAEQFIQKIRKVRGTLDFEMLLGYIALIILVIILHNHR